MIFLIEVDWYTCWGVCVRMCVRVFQSIRRLVMALVKCILQLASFKLKMMQLLNVTGMKRI